MSLQRTAGAAGRCEADGVKYLCGQKATFALSDMLGQHAVTCHDQGQDRYGRTLGRCFIGGTDVQASLVRAGWAIVSGCGRKTMPQEQAMNLYGTFYGTFRRHQSNSVRFVLLACTRIVSNNGTSDRY